MICTQSLRITPPIPSAIAKIDDAVRSTEKDRNTLKQHFRAVVTWR